MRLPFNKEEQQVFEHFSRSHEGLVLREYVERLIRHVESVRTKLELSDKERVVVADLLEVNFISPLKIMQGEVEESDPNEHI